MLYTIIIIYYTILFVMTIRVTITVPDGLASRVIMLQGLATESRPEEPTGEGFGVDRVLWFFQSLKAYSPD